MTSWMGRTGVDEADPRTRERLLKPGIVRTVGDRVTGVWIVPRTRFYGVVNNRAVYLEKGTRLKATWELRYSHWQMVSVDFESIQPRSAWWQRFANWLFGKRSTVPRAIVVKEENEDRVV